MHRVGQEHHDSYLCCLLIMFCSFCGTCCLSGIMILIAAWSNVNLPTSSYEIETYQATKCYVEQPTGGKYRYDDRWHIPESASKNNTSCLKPPQVVNLTTARMEEIVYSFVVPRYRDDENGFAEFFRWIQSVEGYLLMNLSLAENRSEERSVMFTYEVRLGYQDNIKNARFWSEDRWTQLYETTETRRLSCGEPDEETKSSGVQFGCNFIPFFTLHSILHNYYLLNVRLPADFVGKSAFNRDIYDISDVILVLRYESPYFTKGIISLRVLYCSLTIVLLNWFKDRLHNKPLLLIERSCLFLGISLLIFNFPFEWIAVHKEFYFWPLICYARDVLYYAALVVFFITCFHTFVKLQAKRKWAFEFVIFFTPLTWYITIFLTDLYERFNQLKNPFFNIWDKDYGLKYHPLFDPCLTVHFTAYVFVVTIVFHGCLTEKLMKKNLVLYTRGLHLYKGGLMAMSFLLNGIFFFSALIIARFALLQFNVWSLKLMGPADYVKMVHSNAFLTAVLSGMFGMWSLFPFSFIILLAQRPEHQPMQGEVMHLMEV